MKKRLRGFTVLLCLAFIMMGLATAEDTGKLVDQFYNGLASIIERNMDAPDNCVREVEKYYANNQGVVAKIRKMSEVAMARVSALGDNFDSMSDEELEKLEKSVGPLSPSGELVSQGMQRYASALQSFTFKHPQHALKIAGKAIQLLPSVKTPE